MIKISKQFYHWLEKHNIKPVSSKRAVRKYYFKNNKRYFRIGSDNNFYISKPFDEFDRWANSVSSFQEIPKTYKEFLNILENNT